MFLASITSIIAHPATWIVSVYLKQTPPLLYFDWTPTGYRQRYKVLLFTFYFLTIISTRRCFHMRFSFLFFKHLHFYTFLLLSPHHGFLLKGRSYCRLTNAMSRGTLIGSKDGTSPLSHPINIWSSTNAVNTSSRF